MCLFSFMSFPIFYLFYPSEESLLHAAQSYFSLPWGQGLHTTHWRFSFPCEHRFGPITHDRLPRHRTSPRAMK